MKIFYAIQATGHGHISRALQLYPALSKIGEVDYLLSGNNCQMELNLPIKYRAKGISLYYNKTGKLDVIKTAKDFFTNKAHREASELPLKKYDLIINDFDAVTSIGCAINKLESINVSHQASFLSDNTPRPAWRNAIGEAVLRHYAPASQYLGLHFKPYDHFITTPIIKEQLMHANPSDNGKVLIYLPQFSLITIINQLRSLEHCSFEIFSPETDIPLQYGKISVFPLSNKLFTEKLIQCHGVITGGGFETPAETLFLQKRLITIPIIGQYEQLCNSFALQQDWNILKLKSIKNLNLQVFTNWYNSDAPQALICTNTPDILVEQIRTKMAI